MNNDENPVLDQTMPDDVKAVLDKKIDEKWDSLISTMFELAEGIWVREQFFDKSGTYRDEKLYKTKPDREILQYLANRRLGKIGDKTKNPDDEPTSISWEN